MSAKRACNPISSCDSNVSRSAKRVKSGATEILQDVAGFGPMNGVEHATELRVPEETSLTPVAFFSLFWDDNIIQQLAQATNAYVRRKDATKQQWRHPITVVESRTFL